MSDNNKLYENFLDEFLNNKNIDPVSKPILPSKQGLNSDISKNIPVASRPKNIYNPLLTHKNIDLSIYDEIAISDLPMNLLYYPGTKIMFRDLIVKDVEFFSTLDTLNAFDFKQKLNDILDTCVIFIHPDGRYGSYLDIEEGDRVWILYTIREKSFLNGHKLIVKVGVTDKEGKKITYPIEMIRANIELWNSDEMNEYFSFIDRCYIFDIDINGIDKTYKIAPPTIGLVNCFDQYLRIRYDELKDLYKTEEIKDKINSKFFQLVPYMKPHVSYMSYDELRELERWFTEDITESEFFFLDDLINNHLKLGIRGLKKNMANTNIEIRSNKVYPERPRDFFYVYNAFRLFLKQ